MKISKLFHWLYASVMMLPLFASIVFAIYTRNENSTFTQSVQYNISKVVNFNQNVLDERTGFNAGISYSLDYGVASFNGTSSVDDIWSFRVTSSTFYKEPNHKYYLKTSTPSFSGSNYTFYWYAYNGNSAVHTSYFTSRIINLATSVTEFAIGLRVTNGTNINDVLIEDVNIFDLTEMFGYGNEPTMVDFDSMYSNGYYLYNTGTKELLHNYSTEIFNNTDVGSQLIYTLYNSTNNYFNVTSFLGLNNLYDWINFNVFNGTASLGFSLFYMLLSYWLLVSIFWLVFDVVMYVPNLAHRWLDKSSLE